MQKINFNPPYSFVWLVIILLISSRVVNGQTLFAEITPASTGSSNDGIIDLTVNYGYPPYTFEWSNGETTEDIDNLPPGSYTINVYDSYCGVVNWDLDVYSCDGVSPPFTIDETHINASNSTSMDGQINITVNGVSPGNYQYYWEDDATGQFFSNDEDVSGLSAGFYTVKVQDACGSVIGLIIEITSCNINVDIDVTNESDLGALDGSINLTVSGPNSFSFEWSNGETIEDINNLEGGVYSVTITSLDGTNNCVFDYNIIVEPGNGFQDCYPIDAVVGPGSIQVQIECKNSVGFTYEWSDGGTGKNRTDLEVGTYCVTATSNDGCVQIGCWDIDSDCNSIVLTNADVNISDACGPTTSGSIDVLEANPDLYYFWQGPNGYSSGAFIYGLPAGEYCLSVSTNPFGALSCPVAEGCFTVNQSNDPCCGVIEIESYTGHIGCSNGLGYINILAIGPPPLKYSWSNGSNQQNQSGLSAGEYSVTVTSWAGGCTAEASFEVQEALEDISIELIEKSNANYCNEPSGECYGSSILVEASGGLGSFSYAWSGPSGYSANGDYISTLCEGDYRVTVTSGVGCTATMNVNICCCNEQTNPPPNPNDPPNPDLCNQDPSGASPISISAHVLAISDPPNYYGNISISASGGLGGPPYVYSISWSKTGDNSFSASTAVISDLLPGEYCVTVSEGCSSTSECFNVYTCDNVVAEDLIHDITPACGGFNNGSFGIILPNQNYVDVVVTVNGAVATLVDSGNENISTFSLGSLVAGEYDIVVTIGSCEIEFLISISTNDVTSLSNFNEDNDGEECEYIVECNGVVLDQYSVAAFYAYGDGPGNGAETCKVPIYCGYYGTFIKEKKVKKRKVKGLVYLSTVQAAVNQGSISQYYASDLLGEYTAEGYTDCSNVKYCPGSLEIYDFSSGGLFDKVKKKTWNAATGCWEVDCKRIGADYTACGPDNLQFPETTDGNNSCYPRYENLYLLWLNHTSMQSWYPDYIEGSQLFDFVVARGEDAKAKCTYVTYCNVSFEVLSDNYDDQTCSSFDPPLPPQIPYDLFDGTLEHFTGTCQPIYDPAINKHAVMCLGTLSSSLAELIHVDLDFNGFTNNPIGEIIWKNMTDDNGDEELLSFSFVTNDSLTIPKGMLNSTSGLFYYDYAHRGRRVDKLELPVLSHFIDDWDTEQTINAYEIPNSPECFIEFEDTLSSWGADLVASEDIEINHLSKTENYIYLGGYFSGNLNYFGSPIASSSETAGFLIKLTFDGALVNTDIIENIDPGSRFIFSENRNGEIYIAGTYLNNSLTINGVQHVFNSNEGFFLIQTGQLNQINLFKEIRRFGDFRLLDLSLAGSQGLVSIVTEGNGTLSIDGQRVFSEIQNNLATLSFNNDASFAWIFQNESAEIDTEKFDATFDNKDNLYYGLTFSNTISLGDSILTSFGNKDVCLMKLDNSGKVMWRQQYGSTEDESVSQLFYDRFIVYFGGEFSGSLPYRKLGNYRFLDLFNNNQRSYISMIYDLDTEVSQLYSDQENEMIEKDDRSVLGLATVYPNPFDNNFTIELHSSNITRIEVVNLLDQNVLSSEFTKPSKININLKDSPKGVYLIKYFDRNNSLLGTDKIVKAN